MNRWNSILTGLLLGVATVSFGQYGPGYGYGQTYPNGNSCNQGYPNGYGRNYPNQGYPNGYNNGYGQSYPNGYGQAYPNNGYNQYGQAYPVQPPVVVVPPRIVIAPPPPPVINGQLINCWAYVYNWPVLDPTFIPSGDYCQYLSQLDR